ncbi:MAG: CHC2 zinc finger domain-containing protein [Acidimicrobiales bacterium]
MTGPSPIEAALRRHRLAEVARRTGVLLNADTGSVTVRCPLPSHGHPDRTPSLRLYLDDDRYYCFGCGAKGDIIQWARDTKGVGVHEAIRVLDSGTSLANAWAGMDCAAADAGHPWSPVADAPRPWGATGQAEILDRDRTSPERVLAALDAAWSYYTCPSLHARASAYLAGRSIDVAVLEVHTGRPETGHTPARADGLVTTLRAREFSDSELVDAGLAHRQLGGGPASDFYRQRVLIPIRDDHQRIVGLIGRNVGDQERWAKYKNPPHTAVYDKSINLYQPLPAPTDRQGHVVVVEGTLDAMAIAVAAIRTGRADQFCPVTQSGRELSDTQVRRIIALHPSRPVLAFDGDDAGRDSAARYEQTFVAAGWPAVVSALPAAHDPASWLAAHGDAGLDTWHRDDAASADRGFSARRPSLLTKGAWNAKGARVQPLHSGRAGCTSGETPTTEPEIGSVAL